MCVHTCFSVCVFCLTQGTWIWFIEWQFWIHRFKLDLLNKLILSSFCVVFASSLFCYILPVSTWSVLVYERSHFFNKYISAFRLFWSSLMHNCIWRFREYCGWWCRTQTAPETWKALNMYSCCQGHFSVVKLVCCFSFLYLWTISFWI